jgi:hypothetical protein
MAGTPGRSLRQRRLAGASGSDAWRERPPPGAARSPGPGLGPTVNGCSASRTSGRTASRRRAEGRRHRPRGTASAGPTSDTDESVKCSAVGSLAVGEQGRAGRVACRGGFAVLVLHNPHIGPAAERTASSATRRRAHVQQPSGPGHAPRSALPAVRCKTSSGQDPLACKTSSGRRPHRRTHDPRPSPMPSARPTSCPHP